MAAASLAFHRHKAGDDVNVPIVKSIHLSAIERAKSGGFGAAHLSRNV